MSSIPENVESTSRYARTLVNEKFEQSKEKADEAWTHALDYLTQLADKVTTPNLPDVTVELGEISTDGIGAAKPTRPGEPSDLDFVAVAPPADTVEIYNGEITDPGTLAYVDLTPPSGFNFNEVAVPDFEDIESIEHPTMGALLSYPTNQYFEAKMDEAREAILDRLIADAADGATGLGATVEAQLWDRALSRQELKVAEAYREAEQYFSSRGFDLPPGSLSGRLLEIQAEFIRSNTDLNSDIAIKQAELIQANQQFNTKEGMAAISQLELNRIQLISVHNKEIIDTFVANVEMYKADVANLYERWRLEVERYKADLSVLANYVEKWRIEVSLYQANVDRCRLVNEKYKVDVDKYLALLERSKLLLNKYMADLEKYKTDVQTEAARIETLVKVYLAKIEMYKGDISMYVSDLESQLKVIDEKVKIAIAASELEVKEIEVEIEQARLVYGIQVEALKAGAQVSAQMAASALSSVNASASLGFSGGASESLGYNETHDYDETKEVMAESTQYIHNYDETSE